MQTEARKLKVAFITTDLWLGGGAIFVLNLCTELRRRGFDCHVFTVWDENYLATDFERAGVPVSSKPSAGTIYEDRIVNTLELLKAFAPDVVISGSESETGEVIRYLPKGIPRIAVFHLALPATLASVQTYGQFMDIAVAVSKAVGDALAGAAADSSLEVRVLELGIQSSTTTVTKTFSPDAPLRVLYLGRLEDPAKRVTLFPRILERLKSASIPFVWNIAGVGPERDYLEQTMVSNQPHQRVRFLGPIPHSEVPALLAENDVFLLTSDSESFCLGLHEAMAAGLVPVASRISGPVGDIVDEASGKPVPVEDIDGYAEAIIWLHEHRKAMARMSAVSRARIQKEHSAEAMADRWIQLLSNFEPAKAKWPDKWRISPPLHAPAGIRFSPFLRGIRRWRAKIHHYLSNVSVLRKHFGFRVARGRGSAQPRS